MRPIRRIGSIKPMVFNLNQKLFIPTVGVQDINHKIILIAEPEIEMCGIYQKMLQELDFLAHTCHELHALDHELLALEPHVLILNVSHFAPKAEVRVKGIRIAFPNMSLITLSDTAEGIDLPRLMELGIIGHVNKQLTRPKDVVTLVKHVLSLN